jgi:hypothetical protein
MKPSSHSTSHASSSVHASKSHATHKPVTEPETAALTSAATATPVTKSVTKADTLAARVARAVEAIESAKSALGLGETALSPSQIQRSLKFKKGGEQYVPQLAALSTKYGVEVPSRPTADMTSSLQTAQDLEPVRTAIGELTAIVNGAYTTARSETWVTATSLYSMMKKGGEREPKLGAALQSLQDFFANRHPTVRAEHPKRSPTKQVDKAQAKAQKQIAKLQQQLAQLQAAVTAPETTTASTPAPAPAAVEPPSPAPPSTEPKPTT